MNIVSTEIVYRVYYKYPFCYDDGGPVHDQLWGDTNSIVKVNSDKEAQIASLGDEFWRKAHCWCRGNTTSYTKKIVKSVHQETEDGFSKDSEIIIPLPTNKRCDCGKIYWPILGEKACHKLVKV